MDPEEQVELVWKRLYVTISVKWQRDSVIGGHDQPLSDPIRPVKCTPSLATALSDSGGEEMQSSAGTMT